MINPTASLIAAALLIPFCCAACAAAPATDPARDLRAEYLALKAQPDTPDRAAKIDRVLRDYFDRAIAAPARAQHVAGIVTDPAGKPMRQVMMIVAYQVQRSAFNGIETIKTEERRLPDGRFDVSWKESGADRVSLTFTDTYFYRISSGFVSREVPLALPDGRMIRGPANTYNPERARRWLEDGIWLPVPSDPEKLQLVIRKLDRDPFAKPAGGDAAPNAPEPDLAPGAVVITSNDVRLIPAPVDGIYALYFTSHKVYDMQNIVLRRGELVGFRRDKKGVLWSECKSEGGTLPAGEVAEWRLTAQRPHLMPATRLASKESKP